MRFAGEVSPYADLIYTIGWSGLVGLVIILIAAALENRDA